MTDQFVQRFGVRAKTPTEMADIAAAFDGETFRQITIKSPAEIDKMRAAGRVCAEVLEDLSPHVRPGATLRQLNELARSLIVEKYGAEVDRLVADAHQGTGLASTTRVSACFGLNEMVANAEASDRALQIGDLFGIDVSARKDGWCGDTRKSWIVGGDASPLITSLYSVSLQVMWLLIGMVKPGARLDDLAAAAERFVAKAGFSIVGLFPACGHSIGRHHNDGWIIPYRRSPVNAGRVLQPGMVFSVEAYVTSGSGEAVFLNNALSTIVTSDGAPACYWEHIVAVTDAGYEILDLRAGEDPEWAKSVVA
jgi:methionyl aminopeptidase